MPKTYFLWSLSPSQLLLPSDSLISPPISSPNYLLKEQVNPFPVGFILSAEWADLDHVYEWLLQYFKAVPGTSSEEQTRGYVTTMSIF